MKDVIAASAAALTNMFPALEALTPCERYQRFKLVLEAALLARAEFAREEFSNN